MTAPSHIDHVNIVVSDLPRACHFYGEVLGLEKSFEKVLEGTWVEEVVGVKGARAQCVFFEFPSGKTRIELLRFEHPDGAGFDENGLPFTLGIRHIAFHVDDLDAFKDRLESNGVSFYSDPVTVPFPVGTEGRTKRLCYLKDPEGVLLEVASYRDD